MCVEILEVECRDFYFLCFGSFDWENDLTNFTCNFDRRFLRGFFFIYYCELGESGVKIVYYKQLIQNWSSKPIIKAECKIDLKIVKVTVAWCALNCDQFWFYRNGIVEFLGLQIWLFFGLLNEFWDNSLGLAN